MSWEKISCRERDELFQSMELKPYSGCTDLNGEFHGAPKMSMTWSDSEENQVLREFRYPAWPNSEDRSDRNPCEHYKWVPEVLQDEPLQQSL